MSTLATGRVAISLLTLVVLLATVTGVAVAQGPSITVSVNGEQASEGETVRTTENPDVEVSVEADSSIELVEIRVDGKSKRSFEPGQESFSKTVTLDLDEGEHTLKVIASADETSSFETTVLKDSTGPFVEYTNPFRTPDLTAPPDETIVSDAEITLAGELVDDTGVTDIQIERKFKYDYAGDSEQDVKTYRVEDPGDSFSKELFLGDGDNKISITYTDELGNTRIHDFTLDVNDGTKPTVDLTLPSKTGASQVRMQGQVTDNVKLQTVSIQFPSGQSKQVITERSPEPNPDRLAVEINEQVSLREGENRIVVTATDNAGNTRTREFQVVYDRSVAPRITIDKEASHFEGGSLVVKGRVDRGEISDVTIESIDDATGDIVDIVKAYSGGGSTNRVDIDHTLSVADGKTHIRVLVTDSSGDQHERQFTVFPTSQVIGGSGEGPDASDDTSTATPTPTPANDTSTTKAASKSVSDASTPTPTANSDGSDREAASQSDSAESSSGTVAETPSAEGPGFTVVVALVAVVLAGVRLAQRA